MIPTRTTRRLARGAGRGRSQAGFTMLEVLLVVALMAMILVPLFGFAMLGFSETGATMNRNAVASDVGLAQTYFARDAASATLLADQSPGSYGSCTMPAGHSIHAWAVEESVDDEGKLRVAVALYTSGPETERDGTPVAGQTSLYRLECQRESITSRANSHQVGDTSETQLVRNIGPVVSGSTVGCAVDFYLIPDNNGSRVRNCDAITFGFTPQHIPVMTELRGRRVSGSDSDQEVKGIPAPRVSMVVSPEDPPRLPTTDEDDPYRLDFEATATVPPDWTLVGWEWSVLSQGENLVAPGFTPSSTNLFTHDFDPASHDGRFTVRVTVTVAGTVDGEPAEQAASSYRVIDPANQAPVVRLNSAMGDRVVKLCRPTNFSMVYDVSNANASYDPDDPTNSDELRRPPSWSFSNASGDAAESWRTSQSPTVQFNGLGLQSASLTLADSLGLTSTFTQRVYVDRGGVNFSASDDGNDASDTPSTERTPGTSNPSFTRRSGGYREIFFRPKDWRCGGTLVNISLYECTGAVKPEWEGRDITPAIPRVRVNAGNVQEHPCHGASYKGSVFKCQENIPPGDATRDSDPPRWAYDLDKHPCTPTPDWAVLDGAPNGNVMDPATLTSGNDMPNSWRFRARWDEPGPVGGNWFVQACTDMHRDNYLDVWLDENEWAMPAQLCHNSPVFTRN